MKIVLAVFLCIIVIEIVCVDAFWSRRRRRRRRSCSAVNCALGNWQEWGACSITCGNNGTETRIRTETTSASCGGAACSGARQEQRACSPGCTRGIALPGYCANCPFPYTGNCCDQFIEGDPCTTHIELNQPWRSINYPPEADNSYHYAPLINYWYRFVGEGGGDMPTACVKVNSCGVPKPIWLFDNHPVSDEGAVTRVVCSSESTGGDESCCMRTYNIEVKNCAGNYYVYKLFQPPNCDEGFCAGTEAPCPPGTKSPNGYTPDCMADPPPDTCIPTLVYEGFQFVCSFDVQYYSNISYSVQWYAAGVELEDFPEFDFSPTPGLEGATTLSSVQLSSIMTSSHAAITCTLSARYVYSDGTSMSESTPLKESNAVDFVVT